MKGVTLFMRPGKTTILCLALIAALILVIGLVGCGDDDTTVVVTPTVVPANGTVSGTVFEANGTTPIGGSFVALYVTGLGLVTATENPAATETAGANGEFTFADVPLGVEVTIEAWRTQTAYDAGPGQNPLGAFTGNFTTSPFTTANITDGLTKANGYAGSDNCQACHNRQYDQWSNMGHKYKLVPVSGQAPTFPNISRDNEAGTGTISPGNFPGFPAPPPGVNSWDELGYMFGNFIFGGRFITSEGFFLTDATGATVSYNLENGGEWINTPADVTHSNTVKMSRYTCYSCHVVGMDGATDNPLPGMNNDPKTDATGSFVEAGIGCEACHGPGLAHVQNPDANPMTILTESDATGGTNLQAKSCGDCHSDEGYGVEVNGNVFANHARGPLHLEIGTHPGMDCQNCHNPHASTAYGLGGVEGFTEHAVSNGCETCHEDITVVNHSAETECVACHMPVAGYHNTVQNQYHGDARALHIFKINPDASITSTDFGNGAAFGIWDVIGTGGSATRYAFNKDANGHSYGITLDYVCFQCHGNADNGGVGGPVYGDDGHVAFPLNEAAVQAKVNAIHTP
jgi:hypothetical protein